MTLMRVLIIFSMILEQELRESNLSFGEIVLGKAEQHFTLSVHICMFFNSTVEVSSTFSTTKIIEGLLDEQQR